MKEESVTKEKHFVGISMFQQHMVNDFFVYYRESTIREFLNYLRKKRVLQFSLQIIAPRKIIAQKLNHFSRSSEF